MNYNIYFLNEITKQYVLLQTIDGLDTVTTDFVDNLKINSKSNNSIISLTHVKKINQIFHTNILNAKYFLSTNQKLKCQITSNRVNTNIYQFDTLKSMKFIVPFLSGSDICNIYVQPCISCNFVLVKQFKIKRNTVHHNLDQNKIDYLLNILKVWKYKIVDSDRFYCNIGFTLESKHIAILKQSKLLYDSTTLGLEMSVLHRLVYELKIDLLCIELQIFSSKFIVSTYNAFNCRVIKIHINETYNKENCIEHFQKYKYTLKQNGAYEKEINFNFNDEVKIKIDKGYRIYFSNQIQQNILLQTIKSETPHQYSNYLYNHLRINNNQTIVCDFKHKDITDEILLQILNARYIVRDYEMTNDEQKTDNIQQFSDTNAFKILLPKQYSKEIIHTCFLFIIPTKHSKPVLFKTFMLNKYIFTDELHIKNEIKVNSSLQILCNSDIIIDHNACINASGAGFKTYVDCNVADNNVNNESHTLKYGSVTEQVIAKQSYKATSAVQNGLDIIKSHKYTIYQKLQSGWWFATDENGEKGWIPSNLVSLCDMNDKSCGGGIIEIISTKSIINYGIIEANGLFGGNGGMIRIQCDSLLNYGKITAIGMEHGLIQINCKQFNDESKTS
eukprot:168269_1